MFPFLAYQKEVDIYYFDQVVAKMSPALQTLACDTHVLRHTKESHRITSTSEVLSSEYLLVARLLNDIFPASEEQYRTLSYAYMLGLISYVLLDNMVDNQVSDEPLTVLVQQHVAVAEKECLGRLFESSHPFWAEYHQNLRAIYNALALENECVSRYHAPYTYAVMREVAAGKGSHYHTICYALGSLSGKQAYVPVLKSVYEALNYSDQLGDDAVDWADDFQLKRATFPVMKVAELENIPVADVFALGANFVEDRLLRNGVLAEMCDRGIEQLQQAIEDLTALGFEASKLNQLLSRRLEEEKYRKRNFVAIAFLHGISKSLQAQPSSP